VSQSTQLLKLLIVEDSTAIRERLALRAAGLSGVESVGLASGADKALRLVREFGVDRQPSDPKPKASSASAFQAPGAPHTTIFFTIQP